ncbi:TPA: DUF2550 domain-containing protein [Corynebacterium striatum]
MNSSVIGLFLLALGVIVLACLFLAARRFFMLRERGTSVLLRSLPAKDSHTWRHGVMRYNGEYVEYFKLRSVSLQADLRFNRLDVELIGTRPLDDDEAAFMSEGQSVLHFSLGGQEYEIASDSHGIMGLTAWIEAAPSKRQERLDYRQLRQRATRFAKEQ